MLLFKPMMIINAEIQGEPSFMASNVLFVVVVVVIKAETHYQ